MLSVIFNDVKYNTIKKNNRILLRKKVFRNQLMESVLNLHKNYDGLFQKNIELFYSDSFLLKDSFKKLEDKKWELNCSAIEELSEMKITNAYDKFVELTKSKNQILKITAIKGCIMLNETKGIMHLINYEETLDTWSQLIIIDVIKNGGVEKNNKIELLLTSKNESVVSLGLKIIQTFFLTQNKILIQELIDTTTNLTLKKEASKIMNSLHPTL